MTGRDDHPKMTEQSLHKKTFKSSFSIMKIQEGNKVESPRKNGFLALRPIIMAVIILISMLLIMVYIGGGEFCGTLIVSTLY